MYYHHIFFEETIIVNSLMISERLFLNKVTPWERQIMFLKETFKHHIRNYFNTQRLRCCISSYYVLSQPGTHTEEKVKKKKNKKSNYNLS